MINWSIYGQQTRLTNFWSTTIWDFLTWLVCAFLVKRKSKHSGNASLSYFMLPNHQHLQQHTTVMWQFKQPCEDASCHQGRPSADAVQCSRCEWRDYDWYSTPSTDYAFLLLCAALFTTTTIADIKQQRNSENNQSKIASTCVTYLHDIRNTKLAHYASYINALSNVLSECPEQQIRNFKAAFYINNTCSTQSCIKLNQISVSTHASYLVISSNKL